MFEYGTEYLEQNEIALQEMRSAMSPAAVALAEQMALEEAKNENSETSLSTGPTA